MVRLRRLERWSALRTADISTVTEYDLLNGARSEFRIAALARGAMNLVSYLEGYKQWDEPDFMSFAYLVRYRRPDPKVTVKDLWTDEQEPKTQEEWATAFRSLKAHYWPNPADAVRWADQLARKLSLEWDRVRDLEARNAARRILDGPFDLQTKYESRLSSDLRKYLSLYQQLQARELDH